MTDFPLGQTDTRRELLRRFHPLVHRRLALIHSPELAIDLAHGDSRNRRHKKWLRNDFSVTISTQRDDFTGMTLRFRPGGAFASNPARVRAFGQTLFWKARVLISIPAVRNQAIASARFSSWCVLSWEASAVAAASSSPIFSVNSKPPLSTDRRGWSSAGSSPFSRSAGGRLFSN